MIAQWEILARLLLGALLGGIVGFERQTHGRPAGFRTHILVSTASVLVMIVSRYYEFLGQIDPGFIRLDPARLAAGAMTGIGFLGAGVIVKSGANVQGLTTAASIWMMSVIGLAVGSGLYLPALAAFVITFLSLWTLRLMEMKMVRLNYKIVSVAWEGVGDEPALAALLEKHSLEVGNIDCEVDVEKSRSVITLTIGFRGRLSLKDVIGDIARLPSVKKVSIHN